MIPPWVIALYVALVVLLIVCFWKIFVKAGRPGWFSLIPIYNGIVMVQIAGMSGWWFLAMCIPVLGLIPAVMWLIKFAERFGKGTGFVFGLLFLPIIFYPILGFGDARYTPPPVTR